VTEHHACTVTSAFDRVSEDSMCSKTAAMFSLVSVVDGTRLGQPALLCSFTFEHRG
jgi:hypothetical protein